MGTGCRREMIRDQTSSSVSLVREYSALTGAFLRADICRKVLWLRCGASYDNLLPGITPRCLVVRAGLAMLLSLGISLKRQADIQLDRSTSQAKTCASAGERG